MEAMLWMTSKLEPQFSRKNQDCKLSCVLQFQLRQGPLRLVNHFDDCVENASIVSSLRYSIQWHACLSGQYARLFSIGVFRSRSEHLRISVNG
jgi:hypothetical protein